MNKCIIKKIMKSTRYSPAPLDTVTISVPEDLTDLIENLAHNVHEVWARGRMEEGWVYGPERSDARKESPCLLPYDKLSETEKNYDRKTVDSTIRAIIKLGYVIVRS
jgi:RyR domain